MTYFVDRKRLHGRPPITDRPGRWMSDYAALSAIADVAIPREKCLMYVSDAPTRIAAAYAACLALRVGYEPATFRSRDPVEQLIAEDAPDIAVVDADALSNAGEILDRLWQKNVPILLYNSSRAGELSRAGKACWATSGHPASAEFNMVFDRFVKEAIGETQ